MELSNGFTLGIPTDPLRGILLDLGAIHVCAPLRGILPDLGASHVHAPDLGASHIRADVIAAAAATAAS